MTLPGEGKPPLVPGDSGAPTNHRYEYNLHCHAFAATITRKAGYAAGSLSMKKSGSKLTRGYFGLVAVLAAALFVSSAHGKTAVPVFLLFGQSNMVSMASVNDLTADQKKTVENVMINAGADCDPAKKGKWMTLGPGFGSQAVNFGPELMFGRTLSDSMPGKKIAFIKDAINGSPLGQSSGWLPPSSNSGTGGTLYKNMIAHLDAAIKSFGTAFDTAQYTPRWAGFVWLQGETDAMTQSLANAYETNLGNLIKDIRAKVATPDLPVILPLITTLSIWTYNAKVRGADLVMKQNLENVDTLETKDYPTPDGMHYNAAGQLKIGQISALRWLAMHYNYSGMVPIVAHHHYSEPASALSRPQTTMAQIIGLDLSGRKITASSNVSGLHITPDYQKKCGIRH